jgi:hypothetical protein
MSRCVARNLRTRLQTGRGNGPVYHHTNEGRRAEAGWNADSNTEFYRIRAPNVKQCRVVSLYKFTNLLGRRMGSGSNGTRIF